MKSKKSFKELINGETPVLVDFHAEWCDPSREMISILKEVANRIGEKAKLIKIDLDQHQPLAKRLGVQVLPTFILYKNGEIKWQKAGKKSGKELVNLLEQYA